MPKPGSRRSPATARSPPGATTTALCCTRTPAAPSVAPEGRIYSGATGLTLKSQPVTSNTPENCFSWCSIPTDNNGIVRPAQAAPATITYANRLRHSDPAPLGCPFLLRANTVTNLTETLGKSTKDLVSIPWTGSMQSVLRGGTGFRHAPCALRWAGCGTARLILSALMGA